MLQKNNISVKFNKLVHVRLHSANLFQIKSRDAHTLKDKVGVSIAMYKNISFIRFITQMQINIYLDPIPGAHNKYLVNAFECMTRNCNKLLKQKSF